jgi:hypothetical protein
MVSAAVLAFAFSRVEEKEHEFELLGVPMIHVELAVIVPLLHLGMLAVKYPPTFSEDHHGGHQLGGRAKERNIIVKNGRD